VETLRKRRGCRRAVGGSATTLPRERAATAEESCPLAVSFHSDDPGHQHWFTLQGDLAAAVNGSVDLPIVRTIGGSFDEAPTNNSVQVGHADLTMQGCDHATLSYQFVNSEVAHAFAGLSGTLQLVKIGGCAAP